ncbi:hypothetical protein FKO01_04075 [Mesorhizobium sp. B2-3-3]|nr:hypothetical protein FKO01_04075 [Mesorhizobium sp. B2-3-3]
MIGFDKTRLSSSLAILVTQPGSLKKLSDEKDAEIVKRILRAYHDEHDRQVADCWKAAADSIPVKANPLMAELGEGD